MRRLLLSYLLPIVLPFIIYGVWSKGCFFTLGPMPRPT